MHHIISITHDYLSFHIVHIQNDLNIHVHSVLCRLLTLEQSCVVRRSVDFVLKATQETKLGEVFGEGCRRLWSGAVERVEHAVVLNIPILGLYLKTTELHIIP